MFVYVLSKDGQPLMPTKRFGKVRRMLNKGLAKVIDRCPFTIQLLYETETKETQPVEVGDDTGSKHNGLSAVVLYKTGRTVEVYASEVQMRTDITKLLSARRELRKSRRNRTTRYSPVLTTGFTLNTKDGSHLPLKTRYLLTNGNYCISVLSYQ